MILSDFVGNSPVKARLCSMIEEDRLPHAIIIEGPSGSGKKTLAMIIARVAACMGDKAPCGVCAACTAEDNPDITTVVPEKAEIKVADIRTVRNDAYILPNQSKKRVFIIPEAQNMNAQAQNALLKVLEEPPDSAMFILTCEYTRQLLPTVVSRTAVFTLSAPSAEEVEQYIEKNYPQYGHDEVHAVCTGTIGAALDMLSGSRGYGAQAEEVAAMLFGGEIEMHKYMREFEKDRLAQSGIADSLGVIMHDALTLRNGGLRKCGEDDVRVRLSRRFTSGQLLALCEACERAAADVEANLNGSLFITYFCAAMFAAIE